MSASKPTVPPPSRPVPSSRARPLQWLRGLLKRPLRLERRGLQLHVVLGEPPAVPVPTERPGEVLRRGHDALQALLARHPEARHLMRHLGFLERAIARSGSRALRSEVPLEVLRKAHGQLEMLMREDTSPDLAALAERLERAVAERGRAAQEVPAPAAMQVSEASQSLFDEMERSWTDRTPPGEAPLRR